MEVTSLRSFTALEILDRTFRLYRDNFLHFLVLTALIVIPYTVIVTLANNSYTNYIRANPVSATRYNSQAAAASLNNSFNFLGLISIALILRTVLLDSTLVYMASEANLGRKISLFQAFSAVMGRLFSLGFAWVVYWVLLVMVIIAFGIGFFVCQVLGFASGIVVYFLLPIYGMLTPVLILERVGLFRGMNRAWVLGRTRFWPIFGLVIIYLVIFFVLQLGLTSLSTSLFGQPSGLTSEGPRQLADTIASIILGTALSPILPIGFTLMYYDARIRFEGLDLAFAALEKPDLRPSDLPAPAAPTRLNNQDYVNMLILTAATVVIGLVSYGLITGLVRSFQSTGRF